MTWLKDPPLTTVFRRTENDGEPVNDRRLRAQVDRGEVVRIAPGSYAHAADWAELSPLARHAQRVWEAAARLSPGQIFSHFAAAAVWGIDIAGAWPRSIDVTLDSARTVRSSGLIRRHGRCLDDVTAVPWGRHAVTDVLRTTIDLTRDLPFAEGVVSADRALWLKHPSGPLLTSEELISAAETVDGRGSARAVRAAAFATGASDSVGESRSRVSIHVLGFPPPELQARFVLSTGRDAYADFFWREYAHIGEFDGTGKYRDPELLRGRTPEEALIAEKDREDDLRRQVRGFSRWRTPALRQPRHLFDILTAAGLPSQRSRPGR